MTRRFANLNPAWLLIAFLWFAYVLNHADRQVVYTLFPALQKEFGYSDAVVGLTGALFLWVYALCSPLAGILGDRFSKSKLVTLSVEKIFAGEAMKVLAYVSGMWEPFRLSIKQWAPAQWLRD